MSVRVELRLSGHYTENTDLTKLEKFLKVQGLEQDFYTLDETKFVSVSGEVYWDSDIASKIGSLLYTLKEVFQVTCEIGEYPLDVEPDTIYSTSDIGSKELIDVDLALETGESVF